jgi:hypothetical protein
VSPFRVSQVQEDAPDEEKKLRKIRKIKIKNDILSEWNNSSIINASQAGICTGGRGETEARLRSRI